ncbi:SbcC/MukB-like Walker B domain-containing protein [Tenacibaculum aestuariivivum]|uniref:SbcC/MukB-like Walker B domain-containing protein n=1 Tax=Tenacibaculum aestuariivivum TaxID=2006131 RepID=UPI003AB8B2F2
MKILKIELQNINSLKSDTPIIIDFENDQFKDVGLYAITGATGAGKTTVLDAITIALYHNVPRFNGTKGTLVDVVSHGANNAFSRVTFENDTVVYEAFWSIRIADKSGKTYKNPKEEVSLKNLTTSVILATQKRILLTQITKVTQLDYTQFLRSVLLAQGEFASFLSAKGPEKGKLLEQITGEEIYKKIGQGISDRKLLEENKLKELSAKINEDDILSEERKNELLIKEKELIEAIIKNDKEITANIAISDWYAKFKKLTDEATKLDEGAEKLTNYIEKYKEELALLSLNEKATPFTVLIDDFIRNEKRLVENTIQLKILTTELTALKPQIENLENQTKNEGADLEKNDQNFTSWMPKFDVITQLDSQLKNEIESTQKVNEKIKELRLQFDALEEEKKKLTIVLSTTTSKIKKATEFVDQNKFLTNVGTEISSWTTSLTTLKAHKETLKENTDFVVQKKEEVTKTIISLTQKQQLLSKNTTAIAVIEKDILNVTNQLSKNNITNLLATQKQLSLLVTNWKEFKNFSEEVTKYQHELAEKTALKKEYTATLSILRTQIKELKEQIATQEILVLDAEKIVNLEKSIAKYETDRQTLKTGEPCGLCGAKEHPFTENLKTNGVSNSEKILKDRKISLKNLEVEKANFDKNYVKCTTYIDGLTPQINTIIKVLRAVQIKASALYIDCELSNTAKIELELKTLSEKIVLVDNNLKIAQQLQLQKDALIIAFKEQNNAVSELKTTVATFVEKINNTKTEIQTKQKSITNLSAICTNLENSLQTKLAKFNYQLPAINQINLFIQKIEKAINQYTITQQHLQVLLSDEKVLNTSFINNEKQLAIYNKNYNDLLKLKNESSANIIMLQKKRMAILPLNITVETKRESLQLAVKKSTKKLEATKKTLQKLLDAKREKEILKLKNIADEKVLKDAFMVLKASFDTELKMSNFESKEAVEKALLPKHVKERYTEYKEKIKKNQVELKALKEANTKSKEALRKAKNFNVTIAEVKLILDNLKLQRIDLSTQKGEIKEAFRKDEEIKNRNTETYKKITAQTAICAIWKQLFKITGNSKDAFNVYVQRLTLKNLLDLANVHLDKLNKRYSLKMEESYKPKEELNFILIDHYQTDQARLVDTSSGGEKFIISLALALGLSDLASKNVKIDSLFIDEGFGTLDSNTLETVISTLETLQAQGKMIGIISHVENLKERISTQIKISKKSNGVSVLAID